MRPPSKDVLGNCWLTGAPCIDPSEPGLCDVAAQGCTALRITESPPVAVEFEAAFQALDAALHLGEIVRLAAARTGRGVDVGRCILGPVILDRWVPCPLA